MQSRRNFFGSLFGIAAIPLVVKTIKSTEKNVNVRFADRDGEVLPNDKVYNLPYELKMFADQVSKHEIRELVEIINESGYSMGELISTNTLKNIHRLKR